MRTQGPDDAVRGFGQLISMVSRIFAWIWVQVVMTVVHRSLACFSDLDVNFTLCMKIQFAVILTAYSTRAHICQHFQILLSLTTKLFHNPQVHFTCTLVAAPIAFV
ncbi:hypothetical protein ACJX0J_033908 [Zea mays]